MKKDPVSHVAVSQRLCQNVQVHANQVWFANCKQTNWRVSYTTTTTNNLAKIELTQLDCQKSDS